MYFCVDSSGQSSMGKTLQEALVEYQECYSEDYIDRLKFYKAQEVKVELKEVVVTTTKLVEKKTTTRK